MKRIALVFLLALPLSAQVPSPDKGTADRMTLELAQKDLQIASLTQKLHQAERLGQACAAAFNASFAAQEKQDQQAIDQAQKAVDTARAKASPTK